ncbi:hypothetical protein G7L40_20355 [Paenibacillus polymyxa]|uniref:Uncharacterized protein n=1 Tax=Paenibacillus polymyxa TaxID=1406 RepID=A0A378XZ71_PAEPO|nr:hypothetical protein [Paenibacillus polymyxa]MBE7896158.1 hypothetical protein [Paenibacillus polymyxa]MBG9765896.1 hypothetical protein [Paenibacillus polymyxa]MCC3256687.1 hypothetical protein [Paenibacillus polymyxa]QPK54822.1 hypothetical protein G7035_20400 [Paenibacillus polymyxa]QPK59913.1 hypothetical protein G7L40_20355 [Paenibacillus polymyxa]
MRKDKNNKNINEENLIELRDLRDDHVFRDNVLERFSFFATLGDKNEVTIETISNYYETSIETVKQVIKRNREEFNDYSEVRVLKGKSLAKFCEVHNVPDKIVGSKTRSLMLLNRRGMLRIGMLLRDSEIAKSIRHYLLNIEQVSLKEQKEWAVQREIARIERVQLTDAIKHYFIGGLKDGFEYSTFTNLVYQIIFDSNAKKMKEYYDLDKNDNLRDALSTEDLRKVVKVEKTIASLLLLKKSYKEIKEELLIHKERFLDDLYY